MIAHKVMLEDFVLNKNNNSNIVDKMVKLIKSAKKVPASNFKV